MTHNGGGFFGSYPKTEYFGYMIRNVSLLRIRKECIQPAVTRNNFNACSSCLTTLLIFTAIFELEAWIKRSILSVFSGWQNRNINRTCIVLVHQDKSRQDCNTTSPARLAIFYFSSRYLISIDQDWSSLGLSKTVSLS